MPRSPIPGHPSPSAAWRPIPTKKDQIAAIVLVHRRLRRDVAAGPGSRGLHTSSHESKRLKTAAKRGTRKQDAESETQPAGHRQRLRSPTSSSCPSSRESRASPCRRQAASWCDTPNSKYVPFVRSTVGLAAEFERHEPVGCEPAGLGDLDQDLLDGPKALIGAGIGRCRSCRR